MIKFDYIIRVEFLWLNLGGFIWRERREKERERKSESRDACTCNRNKFIETDTQTSAQVFCLMKSCAIAQLCQQECHHQRLGQCDSSDLQSWTSRIMNQHILLVLMKLASLWHFVPAMESWQNEWIGNHSLTWKWTKMHMRDKSDICNTPKLQQAERHPGKCLFTRIKVKGHDKIP